MSVCIWGLFHSHLYAGGQSFALCVCVCVCVRLAPRTYYSRLTDHDEVFTVQAPRFYHKATVFAAGGWLFGPACVVMAVLFLIAVVCCSGGRGRKPGPGKPEGYHRLASAEEC